MNRQTLTEVSEKFRSHFGADMTSNITFSFVLVPVILLTKKYHVTTAAPCRGYDPKCFLQSCLVTVAEIPSPCCKANKAPCCYLWERLLGTLL